MRRSSFAGPGRLRRAPAGVTAAGPQGFLWRCSVGLLRAASGRMLDVTREGLGLRSVDALKRRLNGSRPFKEVRMALSDQLGKLAARAKEAEDHAAAARGKAKADLDREVETAQASAQDQAEKLRETADASEEKVSAWWRDVQSNWNVHIAKVKDDIDSKRAEHDLARAQRNAESAEGDASFAIDFAYSAVVEAEYAVLDAAR